MVRTWEREGEVGPISRFCKDRRVKGRRPEEKYLGSLRVRGSERARGGPASEMRRGARGLSANCAAARAWFALVKKVTMVEREWLTRVAVGSRATKRHCRRTGVSNFDSHPPTMIELPTGAKNL